MVKKRKQNLEEIQTQMNNLIQIITKIPGDKILTFVNPELGCWVMDIEALEDATFLKGKFQDKAKPAFLTSQSTTYLIVRQFLDTKIEITTKSGEKSILPEKNIYGVFIQFGKYFPLPKSRTEEIHSIEFETGKRIDLEKGLIFCDFPTSF